MDSTPLWAIKGTDDCRDKNQHNYKHVEYDPTTLYIPERAKKDMTCVQRQYWDTKSNYFDKIVLFKNGHHYETYY
jgi:DNA mismatch repair protein MSH6